MTHIRHKSFGRLGRVLSIVLPWSVLLATTPATAQFGSVDPGFIPGGGANAEVLSTALQTDGRIVLGGSFTTFNGVTRTRLARLNNNGSLDTLSHSINNRINAVAIDSNGRIFIGGLFTNVNGNSIAKLARFNVGNLAVDITYNRGASWLATTASPVPEILAILPQSDGKILIAGRFSNVPGITANGIARLVNGDDDGTIDTTFNPPISGAFRAFAFQSDGKLLVGGPSIHRLNAVNGSIDTTFSTTITGGDVYAIAQQPDGKILIGGTFITVNGQPIARLARLNTSGSLDSTFIIGAGPNNIVRTISVRPDPILRTTIFLGGDFSTFNTENRSRFAVLSADGSFDPDFSSTFGADNIIRQIKQDPSNRKLLIVGDFTMVNETTHWNNVGRLLDSISPPTIVQDPQDVRARAGSTLNLSVAAVNSTPSPLAYRWRYSWSSNGPPNTGPTNENILITNAYSSYYQVIITNRSAVVTSRWAFVEAAYPHAEIFLPPPEDISPRGWQFPAISTPTDATYWDAAAKKLYAVNVGPNDLQVLLRWRATNMNGMGQLFDRLATITRTNGALRHVPPSAPFSNVHSVTNTGDFRPASAFLFEWRRHPHPAPEDPDLYAPHFTGVGATSVTIQDPGPLSLLDHWYICRYRPTNWPLGWSRWSDPVFVPNWFSNVWITAFEGLESQFNAYGSLEQNRIVNMIELAGPLGNKEIPSSPDFGLIEGYDAILHRSLELAISTNYGPVPYLLSTTAGRLSDLFMLLGNEAYADALDPTIVVKDSRGIVVANPTAKHCFMSQVTNLLEEELALLRGRDAGPVTTAPVFNRLYWNTNTADIEASSLYFANYGVSDASEAITQYPQGHGDAWGHYLAGAKGYYRLWRHPNFTWGSTSETVGTNGLVPFLHERRFAAAAAVRVKTGAEIVNSTYRELYVENPALDSPSYLALFEDPNPDRAWSVSEWASRTGQGAFFDWVIANALVPATGTNGGLARVDRTTVRELGELAGTFQNIQGEADKADLGLNPLGLAKNVVPFDINPGEAAPSNPDAVPKTHFEQIYARALAALRNAKTVFEYAQGSSLRLREQADSLASFQDNVTEREADFTNRLVEIFGLPYPEDIGSVPGHTYPPGYRGPDIYHFMYVDRTSLSGEPIVVPIQVTLPLVQLGISTNGTFQQVTSPIAFHLDTNTLSVVKPPGWTQRQTPGELQLAQSDALQASGRFKTALKDYDNLLQTIEDQLGLIQAQFHFNNNEIQIYVAGSSNQMSLNDQILASRRRQLEFQQDARETSWWEGALAVGIGIAQGSLSGAGKGGHPYIGAILGGVQAGLSAWKADQSNDALADADSESITELSLQQAKEIAQSDVILQLAKLKQDEDMTNRLAELAKIVRQEAVQRLELFNLEEALHQTIGKYAAILERGQRLIEEQLRFRQQTARNIQDFRHRDMAFRVFRNEALQQYRAQFDNAALYVYLAAAAYDYETNLRDAETRWITGSQLMHIIVRARSIGSLDATGDPLAPSPGDSSLAAAMFYMDSTWKRNLKTLLGFDQLARESPTFPLRSGNFRALNSDNGDPVWQAWLRSFKVGDVQTVPEFVRYCNKPSPFGEGGRKEPALVIPFSTSIRFGHNFFGWPETGGGANFSSTYFATKIKSVSVKFIGYASEILNSTPHVYLIPVGNDVMLSPITDTRPGPSVIREWKILDQIIPRPLTQLSFTNNPSWIPIQDLDSTEGPFMSSRRFSQFRAYHNGNLNGVPTAPELEAYKRLIGRSAWNTRWLLIILGRDLLNDADLGIERFITGLDGEGVSDIELKFESYSYPSDL